MGFVAVSLIPTRVHKYELDSPVSKPFKLHKSLHYNVAIQRQNIESTDLEITKSTVGHCYNKKWQYKNHHQIVFKDVIVEQNPFENFPFELTIFSRDNTYMDVSCPNGSSHTDHDLALIVHGKNPRNGTSKEN